MFSILKVKKVAQVDKVKLVTLSYLKRRSVSRNILKDFLNEFLIARPFKAYCLLDFDVRHLHEMIRLLLNLLISGTLVLLDIDL